MGFSSKEIVAGGRNANCPKDVEIECVAQYRLGNFNNGWWHALPPMPPPKIKLLYPMGANPEIPTLT